MTLDTFLEITETRIPTVAEMVALADSLGITFAMKDGKPVMKPCPECRDETLVLARLFRREPFRSAVLAAKLPDATMAQTTETTIATKETNGVNVETKPLVNETEEDEDKKKAIVPTPGARIFIADEKGYMNEHRKTEPYQWTWEGATTWYYVADHPPPAH